LHNKIFKAIDGIGKVKKRDHSCEENIITDLKESLMMCTGFSGLSIGSSGGFF
jgi:hypothetical protein